MAGALGVMAAVLLPVARGPAWASAKSDRRKAGAALFHQRGCEHCHGVDARGTAKGPDLGTIGKQWKKPRIEEQIRLGGGGMPAFGKILPGDEVSALVEFLGAKKKVAKGSKTGVPAVVPAPVAGGGDAGLVEE